MTQFDQVIEEMLRRIKSADRKPLDALKVQLRSVLPEPVLGQAMGALTYYIESSPTTLRDFAIAASATFSQPLVEVSTTLYQYLLEPADLLPDTTNGILGFLDDAWLIHNVAYRCVGSGFLGAEQFSVDWTRIATGDQLALQLFPPQVKSALDGLLGQYALVEQQLLGFPSESGTGNSNASSGGKTIDDYYYTIGGTAYLSTRPIS